jgi:predicted TIM-barrel fold metal-dependent hydrolase
MEQSLKTGAVALKSALAYSRSLRYEKVDAGSAEHDFNEFFLEAHSPSWRGGIKAGKALQDHMMHWICRLADEQGLAFQFHTGLQEGNGNIIVEANPSHLTNLFLEYENIRFDIFHMGYPYVMELSNLAKNFRNVNIDMAWGHIISPEAARQALAEWLDTVPANKISAFGGDYSFVDGVYGHQRLARQNVAAALAVKVADGSFDLDRAREIATCVFIDNPTRIFNLGSRLKPASGRKRLGRR